MQSAWTFNLCAVKTEKSEPPAPYRVLAVIMSGGDTRRIIDSVKVCCVIGNSRRNEDALKWKKKQVINLRLEFIKDGRFV